MNQEMHTWIATLLIVLTIKIFFPKQQFHGLKNKGGSNCILINWVSPIITFSLWLYFIS